MLKIINTDMGIQYIVFCLELWFEFVYCNAPLVGVKLLEGERTFSQCSSIRHSELTLRIDANSQ